MHFIPLHINCTKRSGRAEVFAGTAADAFVLIHGRDLHRAVWAFIVDHRDGTRRALARAVAAADAVGEHHAVFLDPHGMAHMLHGRIGIGRPDHSDIAGYVLSPFSSDERIILDQIFPQLSSLLVQVLCTNPDTLLKDWSKKKLSAE